VTVFGVATAALRKDGTSAAARLARRRASVVRAIFGWMLLWVKMLRRLTATQLVVRVVGNECGEFVDVSGGPRDACEVGASQDDGMDALS
jgi:hypothetical protein